MWELGSENSYTVPSQEYKNHVYVFFVFTMRGCVQIFRSQLPILEFQILKNFFLATGILTVVCHPTSFLGIARSPFGLSPFLRLPGLPSPPGYSYQHPNSCSISSAVISWSWFLLCFPSGDFLPGLSHFPPRFLFFFSASLGFLWGSSFNFGFFAFDSSVGDRSW